MRYVYGPVHSRRLGRSLGIDPIPLKTCNWNCVYCQLGRSTPLSNVRAEHVPRNAILAEAQAALERCGPDAVDWVTFVGSGEPTLHSALGWLIREVQRLTPTPVAVITNGALLYLPEVRAELAAADAVLPTLAVGSAERYRRLHRPHPDVTFERLVQGLCDFRRAYSGRLWVEVMLVHGVNDDEAALRELLAVMERVQPDEIQITTPIRPPAETWVIPPDAEGLMRAAALLGRVAPVRPALDGTPARPIDDDPLETLIGILARHPLSRAQAADLLREWGQADPAPWLGRLAADPRVAVIVRHGVAFWVAAPTVFATRPVRAP